MDPYEFSGSWGLVKRNLPGLVGAGIGAVAGALSAGKKAYDLQKRDSRVKFDTWSERSSTMKAPVAARRVSGRRYGVRKFYKRGKGMAVNTSKRFVRSTGSIQLLTVGALTSAYGAVSPTLSLVQTSDLTGIYRLYRIRKVVVHMVPRVDTANSGVANNFQFCAAACCDPESGTAPTSITQIAAYDNSYQKFLVSGDRFKYTFYPKVTNSVDISGVATAAGSYGLNPWLRLDATGITVPHLALKIGVQSAAATTVQFDCYYDIHFDVKGVA